MIGIVTAMKKEANLIIEKFNLKQSETLKNILIYSNKDIILILSWIGKIQASIWTTFLLQNFPITKLINIGIAGNTLLDKDAKVWDIFLINKVVQHDVYLPFDWTHLDYIKAPISLNTPKIYFDEFNLFTWTCATGDQFIDNPEKIKIIRDKFKAHVVEMEAFAVASVAREFNLLDKTFIIKAISDDANEQAIVDHEKNLDLAMKNSIKVLEKIL